MAKRKNYSRSRGRSRKAKTGSISSAIIIVIVIIYYFINGGELPKEAQTADKETLATLSTDPGSLEIHFLDVGQGDSALLICDGKTMLIDAGENKYGDEVVDYLESKGVDKLDYVIGTHPDSDHIGGLDTVIKNLDCETIFLTDYSKDTKTYQEVLEAVDNEDCELINPQVGDTYSFGSAEMIIIAPNSEDYDSANDGSIGLILQNGEHRFYFAGDAEEESESDILQNGIDLDADVYKVSHHGSRTSSMEELVEAIDPEYAVISCGEGNDYGHPHAATLNTLRGMGVKVFRTDEQGTIVCTSDGTNIEWNMSPSETWQVGE